MYSIVFNTESYGIAFYVTDVFCWCFFSFIQIRTRYFFKKLNNILELITNLCTPCIYANQVWLVQQHEKHSIGINSECRVWRVCKQHCLVSANGVTGYCFKSLTNEGPFWFAWRLKGNSAYVEHRQQDISLEFGKTVLVFVCFSLYFSVSVSEHD